MPQSPRVLSTDPNAGEPVTSRAATSPRVLSTDPNAGEPLRVNTRAQTWSDRLGLNVPTESRMTGLLRGSGAGAVDLVQGAVSAITGQLNNKLRTENANVNALANAVGQQTPIPSKATLPDVAQPQNLSGTIGGVLPVLGEMALPGGAPKAIKVASDAIPRTARAGEKFQSVMAAARDIPIETKAVGDVALRIQELAERGGSMPMSVRKLLNRMTDPNKAALTYEESRDFASNISRLSADDYKRLTPVVRREVAALSAELNLANARAAQKAGKGAEYKSAMREYAQAMKLKEMAQNAMKAGKKIAPWATAAGAAEYLTRDLRR